MLARGPQIAPRGADITPPNSQRKVLIPRDKLSAHPTYLPHWPDEHFGTQVIDVRADSERTLRPVQPLFPILHKDI